MRKLQICDSFLVLLSVLLVTDEDGSLFLFLLAALLHEAGHYAALRLCGGRVRALRLTAVGAVMRYTMGDGAAARCVVSLAGPAASLLAALAAAHAGAYRFAGANLLLGAFNLLPIAPLDGGNVLFLLLRRVPRAAKCVSGVVSLGLAALGSAVIYRGGGASLLLMGCFLLFLQKNLHKT